MSQIAVANSAKFTVKQLPTPCIKLAVPFDLGNHPARLVPASGLIGEVRVRSAHVIGRATNRTLEQIANPRQRYS
jgi:hypothetical protein